ncbi:MAG: endonuclease domain-containing protein [Lysobacter sp.]|nr:endonuclease domain-containing protein [Lysobacter sp.]
MRRRPLPGSFPGTKAFARTLRAGATEAELRLWYFLRDRRFAGAKFRRQVPVGPYVVDFLCVSASLIVEADGGQHAERAAHDEERTRYLESQGYRVVRFWNNEVMGNIDGVMEVIGRELAAGTLTPGPSPKGEGRKALPSPSGRRVGDEGVADAVSTLTPGPSPKGEGSKALSSPRGVGKRS